MSLLKVSTSHNSATHNHLSGHNVRYDAWKFSCLYLHRILPTLVILLSRLSQDKFWRLKLKNPEMLEYWFGSNRTQHSYCDNGWRTTSVNTQLNSRWKASYTADYLSHLEHLQSYLKQGLHEILLKVVFYCLQLDKITFEQAQVGFAAASMNKEITFKGCSSEAKLGDPTQAQNPDDAQHCKYVNIAILH